jgi:hypothetical protein
MFMIYNMYWEVKGILYDRLNGTYIWQLFEHTQRALSRLTIKLHLKTNTKCMIVQMGGGLCNRLKRLASCLRMKTYLNQDGVLLLCWPLNYECNCKFSDLFSNEFKEYNLEIEPSDGRMWRFWLLPDEVPIGFAQVFPSELGQDIDYEYERIPNLICEEYLKYINQLIPNKDIQLVVDENSQRIGRDALGVHVRRGDFLKDPLRRSGTDLKFFQRVDRYLDDCAEGMIFLATDCPATQQSFKDRYGKRIVTHSKRSYDRSSKIGVQDAMVDLFLLAKSKYIVGSYLSTFTEMAWWLGQCKAKVEIVK